MSIELTDETIAALSPEAQVIVRALLAHIAVLEKRVAELEAQLGRNSKNSSQPPSVGHPHAKPAPPVKRKSKRRQGAQPGHDKMERTLLPTDECGEVFVCKPPACRGCGERLRGTDAEPLRE